MVIVMRPLRGQWGWVVWGCAHNVGAAPTLIYIPLSGVVAGTFVSDIITEMNFWYRLVRYSGTDSSATMVPIRRYYQLPL